MPKDHQSANLSYPPPARTSGAKYYGVPQKVLASSPSLITLAIPKSVRDAFP